MPSFVVPYAPQQTYAPNGRIVDLIRAQGQDAARAAELRGQQQAQLWGGVGNAIQGGVDSVLRAQAAAPRIALEKAQVADLQRDASDRSAVDEAFSPHTLAPGAEGPQAQAPTQESILAALAAKGHGHLVPVIKKQFEEDALRTAQVAKAKEDLANANASKLSGLALAVKSHGYDPSAFTMAMQSAAQTYHDDPAMTAQLQRVVSMVGQNPSRESLQRVVDSIPLTASDQKSWEENIGKTKKGVSDAGLAALDHLQGEGGNPLTARDILTNRIAQGIQDGSILPGHGQSALMTVASAPPKQLPQLLDQFVTPEDRAAWAQKKAVTAKDLAEAEKAHKEAEVGKTKSLEEQYLSAIASGDQTAAATIMKTWQDKANASRDPAAAAQLAAIRNLSVEAARARLDDMNPKSAKSQQKFEQEYRTVLQRGLSSRSGGLGLEDAKVQQANHLMSVFDQNFDIKTGEWNIPRVQLNELALGLAKLTAPGGQAGVDMLKEFQQHTAKGDLAGALSYLTGEPIAANTQAITRMLKESIERQGQTALQNREGEMAYLRGLVPTDLEESRRQQLEKNSLNPLRQSRVIQNKSTGEKKLQVSIDGGSTWK